MRRPQKQKAALYRAAFWLCTARREPMSEIAGYPVEGLLH